MKLKMLATPIICLLAVVFTAQCCIGGLLDRLLVETSPTPPPPRHGTARPTEPSTAGATPTAIIPSAANPLVVELLSGTTQEQWVDWVSKLSGEEPVTIGGVQTVIETRYVEAMFDGSENARAVPFILEQVGQWVSPDQVEIDDFTCEDYEDGSRFACQNIIVTIPGETFPDEQIIVMAHLDNYMFDEDSLWEDVPGADDNASGSATLLEMARLMPSYRFDRTIKIIWTAGEELGLLGAFAYVEDHDLSGVVGVINLDVIAYDADNDRCIDLSVGNMPESQVVGDVIAQVVSDYNLDLRFDYLTDTATDLSDHAAFWEAGVGAVLISENIDEPAGGSSCPDWEENPYMHSKRDTLANINPVTGFEANRLAIASAAVLAGPISRR